MWSVWSAGLILVFVFLYEKNKGKFQGIAMRPAADGINTVFNLPTQLTQNRTPYTVQPGTEPPFRFPGMFTGIAALSPDPTAPASQDWAQGYTVAGGSATVPGPLVSANTAAIQNPAIARLLDPSAAFNPPAQVAVEGGASQPAQTSAGPTGVPSISTFNPSQQSSIPISPVSASIPGGPIAASGAPAITTVPTGQSVLQIPASSQVFAVWPGTSPQDWFFIGPSDTAPGKFYWGNVKFQVAANVSPDGRLAFGGYPLSQVLAVRPGLSVPGMDTTTMAQGTIL